MSEYTQLDSEQKKILSEQKAKRDELLSPFAYRDPDDDAAIRYFPSRSDMTFRGSFSVDIDKILHNIFYNRYADKTQVFSFYRNDDITRRNTHVQLVARIARIIGGALCLNTDLIEAIALGHDIGHTPFGHVGENYLNELYHENTGRFFNHNVQSVRNLKEITATNLTIPTYDGIICHNGEREFIEYRPSEPKDREQFEQMYQQCYTTDGFIKSLRPFTMEGCVVRISDIIAYLMKDRQDAEKIGLNISYDPSGVLGEANTDFLTAITSNIIRNSLGKPYIKMDAAVFEDLSRLKAENGKKIYGIDEANEKYKRIVKPRMERMYYLFKEDLEKDNRDSLIFQHHINHRNMCRCYLEKDSGLLKLPFDYSIDDIVVDYIASMTDDYFLDIYEYLFDEKLESDTYVSYFEDLRRQ